MSAKQKKPFVRSSRARRQLQKALEEIHMIPVNEEQSSVCGDNIGKGDHLLVIREKLLLEIQSYAARLNEDALTFIRKAAEQRVEFTKCGANHSTTFVLETPGIENRRVQFF